MKVSHSSFKAEVEPKMADPEPGSNVSGVGRDDHLEAVGSRTGKLITCQNGGPALGKHIFKYFSSVCPLDLGRKGQ